MLKGVKSKFTTPLNQVILLGFICLCCPGMFNALSGLGAGGSMSSNVSLVDSSNGALYGCFAIVGFFAGSVTKHYWCKSHLGLRSNTWLLCTGVFWSAQGAIMMSYPEEKNKGKYVAVFWALFNFGGILGSVIALGLNLKNQAGGVSTGTYTAFVVVMLIGVVVSLGLANPANVVRPDGTKIAIAKSAHWTSELKGALMIWKEWRMMALIPAFLASNWFYAYQFRINAIYFDPSTRALNDLIRRGRGLVGLAIIFAIVMAVWAGGFAFQLTFDNDFSTPIHWDHPNFGGPFVLIFTLRPTCNWLMGAMSNDPNLLARYAGFYKAVQSAGAAIAFGIDAVDIPLRWECLICWMLVFVSFPLILLVANKVTETTKEKMRKQSLPVWP
ncbi:hypothetical protein J3Q64DRAFT_1816344 [Phycomyces blakesleeanus]|uniref:Uncharacterized protein n=1 Tax=Phycomyces blakesleeanus TaxID=4837 RepID=A0ABR3AL24_PHYBL